MLMVVVGFEKEENEDDEERGNDSKRILSNSYSRMMSSKVKLPSSFILGGGLA